MATNLEYALLSGNIYQRTIRNPDGTFNGNYFQLAPEPEGWSIAKADGQELYASNGASGFEAAAYTNGNEVVIAYAGTDPDQWQDLLTDAWVGVGGQMQVVEAALFLNVTSTRTKATSSMPA